MICMRLYKHSLCSGPHTRWYGGIWVLVFAWLVSQPRQAERQRLNLTTKKACQGFWFVCARLCCILIRPDLILIYPREPRGKVRVWFEVRCEKPGEGKVWGSSWWGPTPQQHSLCLFSLKKGVENLSDRPPGQKYVLLRCQEWGTGQRRRYGHQKPWALRWDVSPTRRCQARPGLTIGKDGAEHDKASRNRHNSSPQTNKTGRGYNDTDIKSRNRVLQEWLNGTMRGNTKAASSNKDTARCNKTTR